jgi:hypothetical protein
MRQSKLLILLLLLLFDAGTGGGGGVLAVPNESRVICLFERQSRVPGARNEVDPRDLHTACRAANIERLDTESLASSRDSVLYVLLRAKRDMWSSSEVELPLLEQLVVGEEVVVVVAAA